MAQYGKSFVYNGISSEKFNLVLGGFKTVDTTLNNARTIEKGSMNKYRHTVNTWGVNYDDVLKFSIMIMKDPCKYTSHEELRFTREDIREISAWLCSPVSPRLYHMYDYDDTTSENLDWEYDDENHIYSASFIGRNIIYNFYCSQELTVNNQTGTTVSYLSTNGEVINVSVPAKETQKEIYIKYVDDEGVEQLFPSGAYDIIYSRPTVTLLTKEPEYDYFGMFTNIEAADNQIYALQCDFECNTPFALSPVQSVTNMVEGSLTNTISVWNYSDEHEDYVYPLITIYPNSIIDSDSQSQNEEVAPIDRQNIRITNKTDGNRSIQLNNINAGDTLVMDCRKLTVTNLSNSTLMTFEDMGVDVVDYIYFPRLLYGENEIEISGNAQVTITFRYPVKVGAY